VVNIGGDINQNECASIKWTINGGTMHFTKASRFIVDKAEFAKKAAITVDVDAGVVQNLNRFDVKSGVAVNKIGLGAIVAPTNLPSAWTVAEGGLAFVESGAVAVPAGLTMAEGAQIVLATHGLSVATPAPEGVTFAVAPNVFGKGEIVVSCEDETLLAKVVSDINASGTLPSGLVVKAQGTQAVVAEVSEYSFVRPGYWSDAANWKNGLMPPAGKKAEIAADCTLDSAEIAMPSDISVLDGASLTVAVGIALPAIEVYGRGALVVGDGTGAVCASLANGFVSHIARDAQGVYQRMSELTIAANATLMVPDATKFKDVALTVYGTLGTDVDKGDLWLGYAAAGETTYFGLVVDGGSILMTNDVEKASLNYHFAHPALGGRVIVPKPMRISHATFTQAQDGETRFKFGTDTTSLNQGNPADEAVDIYVDNTDLCLMGYRDIAVMERLWVGGGVRLFLGENARMVSGQVLKDDRSWQGHYPVVVDCGQVIVGEGGSILMHNAQNTGRGLYLDPSVADFQSVIVSNGTLQIFGTPKLDVDKRKAVIAVVGDGESTLKTYDTAWWGVRASPLRGVKALDIAAGSVVRIDSMHGDYSDTGDNAMLMDAGAVISGGGSMCVKGIANLWMYGKDNTCTGTLSVSADSPTRKIVMYDGANWAGTVEGRNVELKNSVEGNFATNSFGGLHLGADANFALNFGAGNVGDKLVLGDGGFTGDGVLTFKCAERPASVKCAVASVLKTANALPKVAVCDAAGNVLRGFQLKLVDDPADATRQDVQLDDAAGTLFFAK